MSSARALHTLLIKRAQNWEPGKQTQFTPERVRRINQAASGYVRGELQKRRDASAAERLNTRTRLTYDPHPSRRAWQPTERESSTARAGGVSYPEAAPPDRRLFPRYMFARSPEQQTIENPGRELMTDAQMGAPVLEQYPTLADLCYDEAWPSAGSVDAAVYRERQGVGREMDV